MSEQLTLNFNQSIETANIKIADQKLPLIVNLKIDSLIAKKTILISALASGVLNDNELINQLASDPQILAIAKPFNNSKLVRQLSLAQQKNTTQILDLSLLRQEGNRFFYRDQEIGKIQLLYKASIPGELQARLTYESTTDRFLEYLQIDYKIACLTDSLYHILVFIPNINQTKNKKFSEYWSEFIDQVLFSIYGKNESQLSGLMQTLTLMLNTITLSGRGFSTLEIPVINRNQALILATWYYAVIRDVKKRQDERQKQIDTLKKELENPELKEKDRTTKEKSIKDKESKQLEEADKYNEGFQKGFTKLLSEQQSNWLELDKIKIQLTDSALTKAQKNKLLKQQDTLLSKVIFSQESITIKQKLFNKTCGNPFKFIEEYQKEKPDLFIDILNFVKYFNKKATDQIAATKRDIFTQCISEMFRLLEMTVFEPYPPPLLREKLIPLDTRIAGDDGKHFCYACGVTLDSQKTQWKVARFMFEKPSQRRQSSSGEDRPYICSSCSVLAFASPLKVTDESIILQLKTVNQDDDSQFKLKEYLRMLTTKEININAGRYIVLTSDSTTGGDFASQKLGQIQYALAKVASIFPREVLTDFQFSLILQGSQAKQLKSYHLIFIKGLMDGYSQSIIQSGKEINLTLGDAIRYVENDLPYLAEYTLAKIPKFSNYSNSLYLENVRKIYSQLLDQTLGENPTMTEIKRSQLYKDVAALTGLTYAFASSLESTARKLMKPEDAEREVSKLIEQVNDPIAFCYYATLGDEKKTNVQARLFQNPDTSFIYEQTKVLLTELELVDREQKDDQGRICLQLYADDITRAYAYFSNQENEHNYAQERDWKNLTYNLKLSLYTRFPELVRKLSNKGDK